MAVSAYKTYSSGEVLTAADLNSSLAQIHNNGEDLGWPATKAKDLDGQELILDADADTSITCDTDDRIDFRIGGIDRVQFNTVNNAIATITNAGTGQALLLNQDGEGISLDIDSEATTADVVNISPATLTTGNVIDVPDADALTTGSVLDIVSNSASTSARELVQVTNDNSLATSCTVIAAHQDAAVQVMVLDQNAAAAFIDYQGTSAADETNAVSTQATTANLVAWLRVEINGTVRWQPCWSSPVNPFALDLTGVQTTNYTAAAGERVPCDTGGGAWTLTLPLTPSVGDVVAGFDYGGDFHSDNLTIGRNGENIEALAENVTVRRRYGRFVMQYVDATQGWKFI